jgi:predicted RNase H-like nuclease (RuvC/YqgF family)
METQPPRIEPMTDNVTRLRTTDTIARVAVLEHQIGELSNDIKDLETKVDQQYTTLHSRISDLRDDVRKEIGDKHDKLIEKLDTQAEQQTEQHRELSNKVSSFEKWRWMIMGGAVVIGYVLAHIKLDQLF